MGRVLSVFVFAVLANTLVISNSAWAYIKTVTPGGAAVSWRGSAKLNLAGYPTNKSGISEQSLYAAVVHGLQRWKRASEGSVSFDYWQGTDPLVFEANSNFNGLSSLYFTSSGGTSLATNVLGLTQVWYNTSSGQILETDIALNDNNFTFTTDPKDTTGYGAGTGGGRKVFIENVLTHELGHAFGLSHSGGLQSTMLFMESPEQAFLGCDEQAGIRAIYGSSAAMGMISGHVSAPGGGAVFGAHVVAISRQRGTMMASGITDPSGNYVIDGLEPGDYFMMAEPYFAGSSALPNYYSGMNDSICSFGEFSRTFSMGPGNIPFVTTVQQGGNASAPEIAVRCDSAGAAVSPVAGATGFGTAPIIHNGSGGFGVVDRINGGGSLYYRISSASGHIEAHALAYSIYSPLGTSIRLLNSSGSVVAGATVTDNVYVGTSGYTNYDAKVSAENLPPGDYVLEVSGSHLGYTSYPAGSLSLDTASYVVVTGGVNDPGLAGSFPDNGRCKMSEDFESYSSPPGQPPRFVAKDDTQDKSGFCGTIRSSDGSGKGPGSSPGAIAGWLLPWVLMIGIARGARRVWA